MRRCVARRHRRRRGLGRHARRRADRGAARARSRRAVLRHGRAQDGGGRLRGLGVIGRARASWGSSKCSRTCRGCCGCARALHRAIPAARGPTCSSASTPGIQSRPREAAEAQGLAHGAVREPAGVGVAPGARAAPSAKRSTSCCACCRSSRRSTAARRAGGVRRPSAGGPDSARSRSCGRAPRAGHRRRRRASSRCCRAAGWAKSSGWARISFAAAAVDSRAAGPALQFIAPMASRAVRDGVRAAVRRSGAPRRSRARRPGAAGAGGGRRRARGLRHGDARDRLAEAADGRGVPARRADGVLLRRLGLVKVPYFSQPNLLAGRGACRSSSRKGDAATRWAQRCCEQIEDPARVARAAAASSCACTKRLRRGGAERAAAAMLELRRQCAIATAATSSQTAPLHRRARRGRRRGGPRPLAGPVVAAAVILDPSRPIRGLADSKALDAGGARAARAEDPRARGRLGRRLGGSRGDRQHQHPAGHVPRDAPRAAGPAGVPHAHPGRRQQLPRIDDLNLGLHRRGHHRRAMPRACDQRRVDPRQDLARRARCSGWTRTIPGFDFAIHKGYSTPAHLAALETLRAIPLHRRVVPARSERSALELTDVGMRDAAWLRPPAPAHRVLAGRQRRARAGAGRRASRRRACPPSRSPTRTTCSRW